VLGLKHKGVNCRTRDNKVEEGDFKKAIFFIFRLFQVPKEPRQGFWDAAKPLEQSVCHFEHCKACFFITLSNLIIMIHWKLDQEM
jgi:hypothetical protein